MAMAKVIAARTKELLLSTWKHRKPPSRAMSSRLSGLEQQQEKSAESVDTGGEDVELQKSPLWVPHPRTGIYFPVGHERVVEDIPDGAASLAETFWLRGVDGADKPDSDH